MMIREKFYKLVKQGKAFEISRVNGVVSTVTPTGVQLWQWDPGLGRYRKLWLDRTFDYKEIANAVQSTRYELEKLGLL